MSFLRNVISRLNESSATSPGDGSSLKEIASVLTSQPEDVASRIVSYGYVLARIANADSNFRPEEEEKIYEILTQKNHMPHQEAMTVVKLLKQANTAFGGTENYIITREFKEESTFEERLDLLKSVFEVAGSDGEITSDEEAELKIIANELAIENRDFVAMRSQYNKYRTVFKNLPK
jgi:uncharacterized tellurite resistance protein B-like protein